MHFTSLTDHLLNLILTDVRNIDNTMGMSHLKTHSSNLGGYQFVNQ